MVGQGASTLHWQHELTPSEAVGGWWVWCAPSEILCCVGERRRSALLRDRRRGRIDGVTPRGSYVSDESWRRG